MRIGYITVAAHKGPVKDGKNMLLTHTTTPRGLESWSPFLVFNYLEVLRSPRVQTHPHRRKLGKRTEGSPAQLIYVMTEYVGTLNELGTNRIDSQLKLAKIFIIEKCIYEDVVCTLLQPVFHTD